MGSAVHLTISLYNQAPRKNGGKAGEPRERIPESDQRPDRKVFHPLRDSGKH